VATRLLFLGAATYLITTQAGKRILIDPYMNDSPVCPLKAEDLEQVDLLLITHGAFDHYGDASSIAKRFGCPVICGPDVKMKLVAEGVDASQVLNIVWGMAVDALGVRVRAVKSEHWSLSHIKGGSPVAGPPLGLMVYDGPDVRIYHGGDTALFSDLKLFGELYRPNIGLMHVTLPEPLRGGGLETICGELTPQEAALASKWLGLKYALAMHYFTPDMDDVRQFVTAVEALNFTGDPATIPVVMDVGQTFVFQDGEGRVE
jgi:L-ascorbate metabolism protein UlaG (beta-lactamase superfamily)